MTVAVKNNNKTPLVVPSAVRRKAGFKSGQELEFKASGGVITIVPKLPNLTMPRRAPFTVHSTAPAIAGLRRVFRRSNPQWAAPLQNREYAQVLAYSCASNLHASVSPAAAIFLDEPLFVVGDVLAAPRNPDSNGGDS